MQSLCRRHTKRRVMAAVKVQTMIRMKNKSIAYLKVKSAIAILQCWQRCRVARKTLIGSKRNRKTLSLDNHEATRVAKRISDIKNEGENIGAIEEENIKHGSK